MLAMGIMICGHLFLRQKRPKESVKVIDYIFEKIHGVTGFDFPPEIVE